MTSRTQRILSAKVVFEACKLRVKKIEAERALKRADAIADIMKPWNLFGWKLGAVSEDEAAKIADRDDFADHKMHGFVAERICTDIGNLAAAKGPNDYISVSAEDFAYFRKSYEEAERAHGKSE